MNRREGKLFVLSGPSGVGKGTLRDRIMESLPNLVYSISCTTRKPRPEEKDGEDYHFISDREFEQRVKRGFFLEHAIVHNARYGTLRDDVEKELQAGHDVLMEIDVQGALHVRRAMPECVLIFVAPPSLEVLEARLRARGTEDERALQLRLKDAAWEMKQTKYYDYVIVNDKVEEAALTLRNAFLKERLKRSFQRH